MFRITGNPDPTDDIRRFRSGRLTTSQNPCRGEILSALGDIAASNLQEVSDQNGTVELQFSGEHSTARNVQDVVLRTDIMSTLLGVHCSPANS